MEWRTIKGFADYEVSEFGDVRRVVPTKRLKKAGPLKPRVVGGGYLAVGLWDGTKQISCLIHRLVAGAFCEKPEHAQCVRHLDGERTHNHFSNLCWGTNSENMLDMVGHGTALRGSRHPNSRLTEEQAIEIRKLYVYRHRDRGANALGKRFGVNNSTVLAIVKGKAWNWLQENPGA